MTTIRFHTEEKWVDAIPKPEKANKFFPKWFKKIKSHIEDNPSKGTVKRCVPFIDALSLGYIIPMWSDCWIHVDGDQINFEFPEHYPFGESLGSHSYEQIKDYNLSNTAFGKMPFKWMNPWIIETDLGYSCLFTSPLNHLENRFKILDGVVDTESYYNNINFPFIWTEGNGSYFIEKGMPLVQVIPFKRDNYTASVGSIDVLKNTNTIASLNSNIKDGYRKEFSKTWEKKRGEDEELS